MLIIIHIIIAIIATQPSAGSSTKALPVAATTTSATAIIAPHIHM